MVLAHIIHLCRFGGQIPLQLYLDNFVRDRDLMEFRFDIFLCFATDVDVCSAPNYTAYVAFMLRLRPDASYHTCPVRKSRMEPLTRTDPVITSPTSPWGSVYRVYAPLRMRVFPRWLPEASIWSKRETSRSVSSRRLVFTCGPTRKLGKRIPGSARVVTVGTGFVHIEVASDIFG